MAAAHQEHDICGYDRANGNRLTVSLRQALTRSSFLATVLYDVPETKHSLVCQVKQQLRCSLSCARVVPLPYLEHDLPEPHSCEHDPSLVCRC
jgi:hypothetical protein